MKQNKPTLFLYEYIVNKDSYFITNRFGRLNCVGKPIECTTIFLKIKFPHRESNPGRLRERQES